MVEQEKRGEDFYTQLPPLILASGSPRRAQLLSEMGVSFRVKVSGTQERELAHGLAGGALAERLAWCKAHAVLELEEAARDGVALVLGADTVVLCDGQRMDKPSSREEALHGLRRLAGRWHEVVTGVVLLRGGQEWVFHEVTRVLFAPLAEEVLEYYVDTFHPYDKAGGYGIQEWIGRVGIASIEGSYENVMGLPTQRLHSLFCELMCTDPVLRRD